MNDKDKMELARELVKKNKEAFDVLKTKDANELVEEILRELEEEGVIDKKSTDDMELIPDIE